MNCTLAGTQQMFVFSIICADFVGDCFFLLPLFRRRESEHLYHACSLSGTADGTAHSDSKRGFFTHWLPFMLETKCGDWMVFQVVVQCGPVPSKPDWNKLLEDRTISQILKSHVSCLVLNCYKVRLMFHASMLARWTEDQTAWTARWFEACVHPGCSMDNWLLRRVGPNDSMQVT